MHLRLTYLLLCSLFMLSKPTFGQNINEILHKAAQAINKQQQLSYDYQLDINYISENYKSLYAGKIYVDFTEHQNPLGFRFQFARANSEVIYNGAEIFEIDLPKQEIELHKQAKIQQLSSYTFFNISPITWKYALPEILNNDSIKKSLDLGKSTASYYSVQIHMGQKVLGNLGNIQPITAKRNIIYTVLIDKESFLPQSILSTNDVTKDDYTKTSFTYHIAKAPPENSWYYSNYANYKPKEDKPIKKLALNETAPSWELPNVKNTEIIKSANLLGKVTLLEFWIKNCGYCIAAVPKLNALQQKYESKGLQVVGINAGDTVNDIQFFIDKNSPNYMSVWDKDSKVSDAYGIIGYPTVILLNKQGKLVFQGSPQSEKLEKLLQELL